MPCAERQAKRSKSDSDDSSDRSEDGHSLAAVKKERSRLSSKLRRDAELDEFGQLVELLPVSKDVVSKLDKGSVLRLVISYLQIKYLIHENNGYDDWNGLDPHSLEHDLSRLSENNGNSMEEVLEEGALMLEAMQGFLILVSEKGQVLFVSSEVKQHLGVSQVDLLGNSMLSYIHPSDRREFVKQFLNRPAHIPSRCREQTRDPDDITTTRDLQTSGAKVVRKRMFYVRMKMFSHRPGSKSRLSQYVLTQWSGSLKVQQNDKTSQLESYLVAIVQPVHLTNIMEIRLDGRVFFSRHDLDMRYTFCDPRVLNLLGYEPAELLGKSCFTFHNPLDQHKVVGCHTDLITKGKAVSHMYRFLGKTGCWVWMQTRATIVFNSCDEPQYVVCQNYIQSGEEAARCEEEERKQQGNQMVVPGFIDLTYMGGLPGGARDCVPNEDGETDVAASPPMSNTASKPNNQAAGQQDTSANIAPSQSFNQEMFFNSPIAPLPAGMVSANQSLYNTMAMEIMKKRSSGSMKGSGSKSSGSSLMDFNTDDIYLSPDALELGDISMQWYTGHEMDRLAEETAHAITSSDSESGVSLTSPSDSIQTTLSAAANDHAYSAKPRDSPTPMSIGKNLGSSDSVNMSSSGFLTGMISSGSEGDVEMLEDAFLGVPASQPLPRIVTTTSSIHSHTKLPPQESILVSLLGEDDRKKGKNVTTTISSPKQTSASMSSGSSLNVPSGLRSNRRSFTNNLFDLDATDAGFVDGGVGGGIPNGDMIQKLAEALINSPASQLGGHLMQGDMGSGLGRHTVQTDAGSGLYTSLSCTSHANITDNNIAAELFPTLNDGGHLFSSYNAPISSTLPYNSYHINSTTSSEPSQLNQSETQNQPQISKTWSRKKNRPEVQIYRSPASSVTSPTETPTPTKSGPTLLEKFLTTDKPLNPNEGSDTAFSDNVTAKISKLNIEEGTGGAAAAAGSVSGEQNLLKQLLTGEIDGHKVKQFEQSVIQTRRNKEDSPTPNTPHTPPPSMPLDLDPHGVLAGVDQSASGDLGLGIELFGAETAGDLENIWGSLGPDVEPLMHSELDDILREQMRQEDLWLREYFDDM